MEDGSPITLRGGPFCGLEVPSKWVEGEKGEIILSTMLHSGRLRFIGEPLPVTVTYLRTAPGVATFAKTEVGG